MNFREVEEAFKKQEGIVHRTPLITSSTLNNLTGNRVYLKLENFQKTGSFKVRGAYNKISSLKREEIERGVITASSGNHGQAVAYVARLMNIPAKIVVPEDAAETKINAIKGYNAQVIKHGYTTDERKALAQKLAREERYFYIDSYDDYHIIAGQGTVGLEIVQQEKPDIIVAPIGGGGLISGISLLKQKFPEIKVVGVEPLHSASMYLSITRGRVTELEKIKTIADGLRAKKPGEKTFEIVEKYVDEIVRVEEEDIIDVLKFLLERIKILAEPSGAVSLAGVVSGRLPCRDKKIAVVISGGNVDLNTLASLIHT